MPRYRFDVNDFLNSVNTRKKRCTITSTPQNTTKIDTYYINRKQNIFTPDYNTNLSDRTKFGLNSQAYKITSKDRINDFDGI